MTIFHDERLALSVASLQQDSQRSIALPRGINVEEGVHAHVAKNVAKPTQILLFKSALARTLSDSRVCAVEASQAAGSASLRPSDRAAPLTVS